MKVIEAAKIVLRETGSLHYEELAEFILERRLYESRAKRFGDTVCYAINLDIRRYKDQSDFVKIRSGFYGLRENSSNLNSITATLETEKKMHKKILNRWSTEKELLAFQRLLVPVNEAHSQYDIPSEWSELDSKKSKKNPVHSIVRMVFYDLNFNQRATELFEIIKDTVIQLKINTLRFETPVKVRRRIVKLLIASRVDVDFSDPQWHRNIEIIEESEFQKMLEISMAEVDSENLMSEKTEQKNEGVEGIEEFLEIFSSSNSKPKEKTLQNYIQVQKENVRKNLHLHLFQMKLSSFKSLMRRLLEKMGYRNIHLESKSKDEIYITADIEIGISLQHERILIKRKQQLISNKDLSELRGSFYRFGGVIITTSSFTKETIQAFSIKDTVTIKLIDGEALVELLIKHMIGVQKQQLEVITLDPTMFI